MNASPKTPRYQAYILRCWEERAYQSETALWRFSLENPSTGERRGFTSLEAVLAALQRELVTDPEVSPETPIENDTDLDAAPKASN